MREFLVRKIDRCIECNSCIKACMRRHGIPRMTLEDKKFDCISLPDTCKSCKDPECVKACRKEAMVKDGDRVFCDWEKCVGCGLCARKCPFDTITVIDLNEHEKKGFFNRKKEEEKKRRRALKCDLCHGYERSACVEACPNKALLRCDADSYNDENKEKIIDHLNNPPEKTGKRIVE